MIASIQLPGNLTMVDLEVLQPENVFKYEPSHKLPQSTFIVQVLEGPFTTPKQEEKKSDAPVSAVGKIYLSEEVFRTDVRPDIMARIVRWQRNNAMQGTHKAKTKAEVSGTGKKPYRQKGTGLARQGSLRNPHFRGGGAVFGPSPRDHGHDINKKERRLGLRSALAARLQEGRLVVIDNLHPRTEAEVFQKKDDAGNAVVKSTEVDAEDAETKEAFIKTRQITSYFSSAMDMGDDSVVLVDAEQKETLVRACRNAKQIHYLPQVGLNVYSILRNKYVVITVDALRMLEDRLSETKQRERRYMKRGWTAEDSKRKEQQDLEREAAGNRPLGRIEQRRALFRRSEKMRHEVQDSPSS